MAYQDTSEQFSARGNAIQTTVIQGVSSFFAAVGQFFAAVGTSLINAGEASSRLPKIEALQAKSDAELAEMGLKRDEIVHFVFKDLFYI